MQTRIEKQIDVHGIRNCSKDTHRKHPILLYGKDVRFQSGHWYYIHFFFSQEPSRISPKTTRDVHRFLGCPYCPKNNIGRKCDHVHNTAIYYLFVDDKS